MKYLLHGKLTAKESKTDELAAILLEASNLIATAKGCRLYVVGKDESDAYFGRSSSKRTGSGIAGRSRSLEIVQTF